VGGGGHVAVKLGEGKTELIQVTGGDEEMLFIQNLPMLKGTAT